MKNLLKCSSLIRVAVIMVVMAFMASQVTGTYAEGTRGGGRGYPPDDCCEDAWSKQLTTNRFELVLPTTANPNGEAVLDHETCLVWEQSPATGKRSWTRALSHCFSSEVGDRGGWRLPTIEELASLKDTVNTSPALPSGYDNFFSNVQSFWYWSSTTVASDTTRAWVVDFNDGGVVLNVKADLSHVWCVRGGQGHDAY